MAIFSSLTHSLQIDEVRRSVAEKGVAAALRVALEKFPDDEGLAEPVKKLLKKLDKVK